MAAMGRGIIDWVGQFKALKRDGYHFAVSLETTGAARHTRGIDATELAGMKKELQEAVAI